MTVLDELVKQALVGTSRAAPALPAADGSLGEALRALDDESAEAKLLGAGAVLASYESCGRAPAPIESTIEPAPPDERPACSRRAGDLLALVLSMTNTPAKQTLLGEWLQLAARARQRVPHRLLPALFDYGASYRALRQGIADAADARGAWLMSLNSRWQFAAGGQDDPRAIWDTGSPEQRASAIRRLRETDAAGARELIGSTWKSDGADERAKFVEAMRTSLSPDDEPFLEAALDDRSKQVRSAAADLLARLPNSAFVKRMIVRAEPLLKFEPGARGGLLKRGKPASIEVTLPPERFDNQWLRDGITEKPEERMGQRQWWLVQILSGVPPTHWSNTWGVEPAALVEAARAGEHSDKLLLAWHAAAARNPDPKWSAALLRTAAPDERRPMQAELLNALAPADRAAIMAEMLESPKMTLDALAHWVGHVDVPLDRRAATAALKHVEQHMGRRNVGYDYHVAHVLEHLALRVPPEFHDELAKRWTGGAWEQNRTTLDKFFGTLSTRRDIQREFIK